MRIITGTAKGKRLATLEGVQTRPTSERAKEAIFSSIQYDIEGRRVLDLFAGSGQLGLEALSRGADSAMFIDASPDAMNIVKENAKATGFFSVCRFLISDYRSYIRKAAGRDTWHLFFIDPPYDSHAAGDALARIIAAGIAAPSALFICETDGTPLFAGQDPSLADRFDILKEAKYGVAHITILRLRDGEGNA